MDRRDVEPGTRVPEGESGRTLDGRAFDERPPLTNTPMLDRETRRKAAENVLHELASGFNDQPILATRTLNRGR